MNSFGWSKGYMIKLKNPDSLIKAGCFIYSHISQFCKYNRVILWGDAFYEKAILPFKKNQDAFNIYIMGIKVIVIKGPIKFCD